MDSSDCNLNKRPFTNFVDKILAFLDHLLPCIDICYGINPTWTGGGANISPPP